LLRRGYCTCRHYDITTSLPMMPGMMLPLCWTGADAAAAPAPAATVLLPHRCRT